MENKIYFCQICKNISNTIICSNCKKLIKKNIFYNTEFGWGIDTDLILKKTSQEINFYNPQKTYKLKHSLLTEYEQILYETINDKLDKKYIILPQINLQTIIETNTNHRNNELYRNLDFCIFERGTFKPILAIELNGKNHKINTYTMQRDISVKKILNQAKLPLIIIENKELEQKNSVEIFNIIQQKLNIIKN